MGDDMATYQQLQQLLNNPNARQMLDIIAKAEGVKQGQSVVSGAAQAQGMVQQSATPRKLYNSKGLQSDMQSRSVDVKMGDLNIYTTASSVSGITSDAMRGVEASLNNLGTSMA